MNRRNFIINSSLSIIGISSGISIRKDEISRINPWIWQVLRKLAKEIGAETIVATLASLLKEKVIDPLFFEKLEEIRIGYGITEQNFFYAENIFIQYGEGKLNFCFGLDHELLPKNKLSEILFVGQHSNACGVSANLNKLELIVLFESLKLLRREKKK